MRSGFILRRVAWVIVLAASAGLVWSQAPTEEDDQQARGFILRALELLEAPSYDCPPEVLDSYPEVQPICAAFDGTFSSLKFSIEQDLRRMEFTALAEPLDSWEKRSGIYHREFKVSGTLVTVDFDAKNRAVIATYGGELPPEPSSESTEDDGDPQTEENDEEDPSDEEEQPPATGSRLTKPLERSARMTP